MDMTRIEKVIEDMRKMNLEQFLVTDPMAVYYLTGQYYACGERMMVLRLDVEKEPVLVSESCFRRMKKNWESKSYTLMIPMTVWKFWLPI